jgi:hypothetical protein
MLSQDMLGAMAFRIRDAGPALLCGVSTHLDLPDDNTLQLGIVAMALGAVDSCSNVTSCGTNHSVSVSVHSGGSQERSCPGHSKRSSTPPSPPSPSRRPTSLASPSPSMSQPSPVPSPAIEPVAAPSNRANSNFSRSGGGTVELTGLGYVPGRKVVKHLDRILVTIIRELRTTEEGNLSVWTSRLLLEAQVCVYTYVCIYCIVLYYVILYCIHVSRSTEKCEWNSCDFACVDCIYACIHL